MLTPLTTYTDGLVTLLRRAAHDERAATAQPIPVPTIRHQCPHCRKTWAKRGAAAAHIARCWHNPDVKACKTCIHYIPPQEGPYPEHPGFDEDCAQGFPQPGITSDCPLWAGA